MESFESIHLDLSKQPGKCRIAESGLGWKPSGGGDTFTLDGSNIGGAQWSRAAKGHELKILSRTSGVIQLDGFEQEVSVALVTIWEAANSPRTSTALARHSSFSTVLIWKSRSTLYEVGIGARASLARQSSLSTFKTAPLSRYRIRRYQTRILPGRMKWRSNFPSQQAVVTRAPMATSEALVVGGARPAVQEISW